MILNGVQDLTFHGREAQEFILEPAYARPEISAIMTVHEGIKGAMRVAYAGQLRKITRRDTGCDTTPSGKQIPTSEAIWNPQPVEMWVAQCYADLANTFLAWGLAVGYKRPQLDAGVVTITDANGGNPREVNLWTEFVLTQMQNAGADDFLRIVFFGKMDITTGQLGPNAAVEDYNQVNGFFTRIFAAGATTRRYTISQNAGATYATQQLPDGAAPIIFRNLVDGADPRLTAMPNQIILVTQTIYNNWVAYRESKNLETSFAFEMNGDGTRGQVTQSTSNYRGIPVIPMNVWDMTIREDFNNGTRYDLPHRAILTTIENLAAGMDAQDGVTQFESHYEWVKKTMHMRGNYMLDTQLVHDYLVSAAY